MLATSLRRSFVSRFLHKVFESSPFIAVVGLLAITLAQAQEDRSVLADRPSQIAQTGQSWHPPLPLEQHATSRHRYGVVPFRPGQPKRVRHNVTPQCNSPQLSYFDGPLLSNAIVVPVFWNSDVEPEVVANTPQFYADATVSSWWNVMYEYGAVNGGSGTNQSIGWGTVVSGITLTPSVCPAGSGNCTLQDSDIQNELTAQIGAGNLPGLTADTIGTGNTRTLYMIHFPADISVSGPGGIPSCALGGFCAYHNTGTYGGSAEPMPYGVMMDEYTSACSTGCGSNATALENTTDTASHELAEAATDTDIGLDTGFVYQYPAAWGDNNNNCGEIADICDDGGAGDTITVSSRTWVVQELWSNRQNKCTSTSSAHPSFKLSLPSTATPGAPFSFTLTADNDPSVGNPSSADNAYVGKVSFSSSDMSATLPPDFTFGPGDLGTANFSATLRTAGSQSVTVNIDSGTASGTSGNVNVQGKVDTSISVTVVSPSSEAYGQDAQVTITAVLSWTGSGTAPTAGNVTIAGNGLGSYGTTSCGAPSGDTMTCMNTYTPSPADVAGTYTETASFSGDSNYNGSTSMQTNNFAIAPAASTTSVGSGKNPSTYGQSVTFTATINGVNGNLKGRAKRNGLQREVVTGSVSWSDSNGPMTCAEGNPSPVTPGNPGTATCTTTSLAVNASDTINSNYSGDANHSGSSGSTTQTINKATATVKLGMVTQIYTGSPLSPSVTTTPSGLSYSMTGAPDTNAGSYPVTATVTDPNYTGSAHGTFVIVKANQTITVTMPAPSTATAGSSFTVAASASSGLAVTYSSGGVCTNSAPLFTMSPTAKRGTCTEEFSQAGDNNHNAARSVIETTTLVKPVKPMVTLVGMPNKAPNGSSFQITASSNETGTYVSIPTLTSTVPAACSLSNITTNPDNSVTATVTMLTNTVQCTVKALWALNVVYGQAHVIQHTLAQK